MSFVREGWPTVTPRIVAHDARGLVDFVQRVFRATGEYRTDAPAILRIGDSIVMISEAEARDPVSAFLNVFVRDADESHRHAVEAGARSLEAPSALPWGDRRGMVRDRWGNTWQIATDRARSASHRPTRQERSSGGIP